MKLRTLMNLTPRLILVALTATPALAQDDLDRTVLPIAKSPQGGPDWGVRFIVTPLFPTGKKPGPLSETSVK